MDEELAARRRPTAWSARLGRAICTRVAEGESLGVICAEPDMPHRATVHRWTLAHPRFADELGRARRAGGRLARSAQLSTYDPATACEIVERLCEGETLAEVCRDPTLPSFATVYRWRRTFPDFANQMATARAVQAERFCDLGWEIAREVTPETAYATKVKLEQLRWTAAVSAPRRFGRVRPVEADIEAEPLQVLIRHFKVETRADGARRVVAYAPNPETMRVERDGEGPWEIPKTPEEVAQILELARPRAERDPEGWT